MGPGAAAGARARQRRRGADHRVPVRAGPGDADGDHGRHRPRRDGRRARSRTPKRSSASRSVDTLVVDKTGTLTEGKPRLASVVAVRRPFGRRRCCGWRRRSSRRASIRWRRRSSRRRASAASRFLRPIDFRSVTGKGVVGDRGRRAQSLSATLAMLAGRRRRRRRAAARRRTRCGATGRRSCSWRVDGRLAALLGVADPIKPTTPRGDSTRCTPKGCGSSC